MAKEVLTLEVKSNIGQVAQQTKDLTKESKKAVAETGRLGKTFTNIGKALKRAGIGLVVSLLAKLGVELSKNQKFVDTFNTGMEFLSIAFQDFFKFIGDNVSTVTGFMDSIFGNKVVQNILSFGKTLSLEVITRVKNLIQGIGGLGKALFQVFNLEFEEAGKTASAAVKNLTEVVTGNVVETVQMEKAITRVTGKIVDYTKSVYDSATAIVTANKASEIAAALNNKILAQKEREAEVERQLRDDVNATFADRIAANERLGEVLEEQAALMTKNADLEIEAARLAVEKNNNDENRIALIDAQANKEAILAQIEGKRSSQIKAGIALSNEETATIQANKEAQLAAFSQLAGALSSLSGDNKALAVAQATIDTYAGATKAFAQGGVAGFATGAAIVVAGLANVKKILSTDVGGAGGGGGSAPAVTPAPQLTSGQFTLGGDTTQPEPVQAFVVTDDMTNSQNKLANIRRRATI